MADIKNIQTIFKKLYGIIKSAKDISEEEATYLHLMITKTLISWWNSRKR
jgi:hypothetical protein